MKYVTLTILGSLIVATSAPAAFAASRKVVSRAEIPTSGYYAQCTRGPGCTKAGYPYAKYVGTPGPRANFYRNIALR
jgi:hypothetical protein